METLTDVKLEPFEQTWKDWFIVDEPKERMKLTVYADKTRVFYVDPRFNRFRFTGMMMEAPNLSQYTVPYMFTRNKLKVQTACGYISVLDINSYDRFFQVILIKEKEDEE